MKWTKVIRFIALLIVAFLINSFAAKNIHTFANPASKAPSVVDRPKTRVLRPDKAIPLPLNLHRVALPEADAPNQLTLDKRTDSLPRRMR